MKWNVHIEFTTNKKMTEDIVFTVSDRLRYLSAALSVGRKFKSGGASLDIQATSMTVAVYNAEVALERVLHEFRISPAFTRVEVEKIT